jgi:hypothetical protein
MLTTKRKKSAVARTDGMIKPSETCMKGSGESISIMEPISMAAHPPTARSPCDVTLTSSTNNPRASAINAKPAALTGRM